MRTASLCGATALFSVATPALAVGTIHCRTAPRGPELWLAVGDDTRAGLFQAWIVHGRETIVTGTTRERPWIRQSFFNRHRLSLRLAPGGARGTLAALTARRRGGSYVGSFTWRGRNWPARCIWNENDGS